MFRDVAFLVFPGFSNLCLGSAVEPLRAVNDIGGETVYRWRILTLEGAPAVSSSGIAVGAEAGLDGVRGADLLVLVASTGWTRLAAPDTLARLRSAARGLPVCGLDTGAWLLAAAGLLDGRRATIHWEVLDDFAERFSNVEAVGARLVIDGDRLTAGGATATLDLMLALIRAQDGPAMALDVANLFIYAGEAPADAPQRFGSAGIIGRRDPVIARAMAIMDETIETPVPLAEIARRAGIGARDLARRFRRELAMTPGAYYRHVRLAAARRLIGETNIPVAEVAVRAGFADASAFTRAYKARFGVAPKAARRMLSGAAPAN